MKALGTFVLGVGLALWARPASAQSIFEAVKTGTLEQAQALVAKDASLVNAKDASGNTPLHVAAIAGSVPMVEWLLAKGADIDAGNTEALTPLLEAIRNGKDTVAQVLIEKGGQDRRSA